MKHMCAGEVLEEFAVDDKRAEMAGCIAGGRGAGCLRAVAAVEGHVDFEEGLAMPCF
jgi:hypothetical protein